MARGNKRNKGRGFKLFSRSLYFDYTLLTVVLFLICIGLVMLFSVSSYDANLSHHDPNFYIRKQIIATGMGLVAMFVVMNLNYRILDNFSVIAYIVSIVLIMLVVTPLGYGANGARRWLNIGPFSLQPAEVAKLGVIIFCASLICRIKDSLTTGKGIAFMMVPSAIVAGLIYLVTDNLSSAIIVMCICVVMFYVATPGYKVYIIGGLSVALFAGIVILLVYNGVLTEEVSYRIGRIRAWIFPEAYASTTAFQTIQALYAIGSGGLFGKGLGTSLQKQFVPEAQNDMIFAIICEELGLFGAALIIGLFVILIWRLFVIANNAPDMFGSMLAIGVLAHIAVQVVFNIAVVTNLIPNTGISLPFISYGGSSVVFLLIEMGVVMSVAKNTLYEN